MSYFEGPRPIEIDNKNLPIDLAELIYWVNDYKKNSVPRELPWTPGTWIWSWEFISRLMEMS